MYISVFSCVWNCELWKGRSSPRLLFRSFVTNFFILFFIIKVWSLKVHAICTTNHRSYSWMLQKIWKLMSDSMNKFFKRMNDFCLLLLLNIIYLLKLFYPWFSPLLYLKSKMKRGITYWEALPLPPQLQTLWLLIINYIYFEGSLPSPLSPFISFHSFGASNK